MLRPVEFGLLGLPFDGIALLNPSGENAVGWTDQIPGFHPGLIQMSPPRGFSFQDIAFLPTQSYSALMQSGSAERCTAVRARLIY